MQYKIAIAGRFRRGKDTLADMLSAELGIAHAVVRLAFADARTYELSEMVYDYIHEPSCMEASCQNPDRDLEIWDATMRGWKDINGIGWQWWGEFRRSRTHEDYWITHPRFQAAYRNALKNSSSVIITDMCHHNELEWCKQQGFYTVRVMGPEHGSAQDIRSNDHPSERHVGELKTHTVVFNDQTLADLKASIHWTTAPAIRESAARQEKSGATSISD